MKHLIGKISGVENRSKIDNLRIIGLLILQEIMQENCPDILKQEGKVDIERFHRSLPTFNPN